MADLPIEYLGNWLEWSYTQRDAEVKYIHMCHKFTGYGSCFGCQDQSREYVGIEDKVGLDIRKNRIPREKLGHQWREVEAENIYGRDHSGVQAMVSETLETVQLRCIYQTCP